jgi:hypothetical protein
MDKSWPILYCSYMNVHSKCCCTVPADYLNLKLSSAKLSLLVISVGQYCISFWSKRGWASFTVSTSLTITKVRREVARNWPTDGSDISFFLFRWGQEWSWEKQSYWA